MDAAALREDTRKLGRELRRAIPDTYRAYGQLHSTALAPGALSTSTKELIALAIAVTRECDGCIAAHAEGPPAAAQRPTRSPRPWVWPSS
jgi:AhpD family alkylhydroperoxidase